MLALFVLGCGVGAARPGAAQTQPETIDDLLAATGPEEPERLGAQIRWRVENPFRFFTDPSDTEVHRATFASLSPTERARPVLSAEHALSQRHPEGWAGTMYRKTCWDGTQNRHVCPDKGDYINPSGHKVLVSVEGVADPAVTCVWLTAPLGGPRPRGVVLSRPCADVVRFDVPYPAGLKVSLEVGGVEVASETIKVRDILIAGIGDSFASGEGNPDVPVRFSRERAADYGSAGRSSDLTGYPARVGPWKQIGDELFIEENARWLDQACHRSLYSFELRAALQIAVEDPHRAVTYIGFPCSGAEVTWGAFLRYKGNEWVPRPPDLSQISAIADAQCGKKEAPLQDLPEAYHMRGVIPELKGGLELRKCPIELARRVDLVFVSIGGNDIGFARLLANAVLSDESLLKTLGGWFGEINGNEEAEELLERLGDRYKALNRALHGVLHIPWDESDRIVLAAYPPLALLGDGNAVCPDGNGGMEVLAEFSLSERAAREGSSLAAKLFEVMAESAVTHSWSFADDHRKAFIGRGLCAGFLDNAFSIADDLRLPRLRDGRWVPYNPADYQAYAPRQRWFRTPNDAFMTGNFHVAGSVLQKALKLESLSWFQVLLASTYSGAFHPTAEGHAAIADAVADTARTVLARHGQQSEILASPR